MNPLVVSASGLASFLRCRKAYQIQYDWNRDPFKSNDAVKLGSSFHAIIADAAMNGWVLKPLHEYDPPPFGDAWFIAHAYMQNRLLPKAIVSAEKPFYTKMLDEIGDLPAVWLRTTIDLAYQRSAMTLVLRDYKTFSMEPSIDVDMDMQSRLYLAAYGLAYPTVNIEFEYDYVRSQIPGSARYVKKPGVWEIADCYRDFVVNISKQEMSTILKEAQWALDDIRKNHKTPRYYRDGLKGNGPHTCNSCFVSKICRAELEYGTLTNDQLQEMSSLREPIVLPQELS